MLLSAGNRKSCWLLTYIDPSTFSGRTLFCSAPLTVVISSSTLQPLTAAIIASRRSTPAPLHLCSVRKTLSSGPIYGQQTVSIEAGPKLVNIQSTRVTCPDRTTGRPRDRRTGRRNSGTGQRSRVSVSSLVPPWLCQPQ